METWGSFGITLNVGGTKSCRFAGDFLPSYTKVEAGYNPWITYWTGNFLYRVCVPGMSMCTLLWKLWKNVENTNFRGRLTKAMHEIIPEGASLPILGTGSYAQE